MTTTVLNDSFTISPIVPVKRAAPGVPVVTAYEGEPHEEIGKATTLIGAIRVATKFLRKGDFAPDNYSRNPESTKWDFTWGSKTLTLTMWRDGSISTRIA